MSYVESYYRHAQADQLAAAILMPKDLTLRVWKACLSVDNMADIFEVPAKCVIIRLEMLGIYEGTGNGQA